MARGVEDPYGEIAFMGMTFRPAAGQQQPTAEETMGAGMAARMAEMALAYPAADAATMQILGRGQELEEDDEDDDDEDEDPDPYGLC